MRLSAHLIALALMFNGDPGHAADNAARLVVGLRADSLVTGKYFRLGDIADIASDDVALAQSARELRIGQSPRVGAVMRVRGQEVERVLRALRPEWANHLLVRQPVEQVSIHRGPLKTVPVARVREAARTALEAFLKERYSRYTIADATTDDAPIVVPEGEIQIRPRIGANGSVPRRISLWTDILVDGRHYQSYPVAFDVEAYTRVLVALRSSSEGASTKDVPFTIEERQVAGDSEQPVPADISLSRLRLKRSLAAGDVLTWRQVEKLPVVSKNQEIRVLLAIGAIQLETTGIALQDAKPGDVIRVRAPDSQQTYPGKVTAEGTLQALWR